MAFVIVNKLLGISVYLAAVVGVFTFLHLQLSDHNDTFTKFSIPPQKDLIGPLALNEKLSDISKLFENQIKGPEGLLYYNNTLYSTVHLGHVIKIVDNQIIPIAKFGKDCDGVYEEHICGRPLGLTTDKKGFLYVADAYYGIFKINVNSPNHYGSKEQIVSMDKAIDGVRPKMPNSIVLSSDGTMYWTDSDTNYALHDGLYTVFADGTGRLIKYDPKTKTNTVLMKNLHFSNGIELSDDESFLIIAETMKFRIHKYYLKGPKAGISEIFIDGLPGMPDNIKKIGKGSFYMPLIIARNIIYDHIGEYPTIRLMIAKGLGVFDLMFQKLDSLYPHKYFKIAAHWIGHFESLSFMNSIIKPRVTILKVDENGNIISSWHSTIGNVFGLCDVEAVGDKLYFGSPFNNFLGVLKLPPGFL